MRKIFFALFLLTASLVLNSTLQAQVAVASKGGSGGKHGGGGSENNSIPASEVPRAVKVSFKSMYPTATHVQWEYKPVYYGAPVYTASFYLNGQKWEANYYADGTFISAYPKA